MLSLDDFNYSVDEEDGELVIMLWRTYSANDLMQYEPPPHQDEGDYEMRVADFIYDEMLADMGFVFRCLYGEGSFPEVDGYDRFRWDWQDNGPNLRVVAEVRLEPDMVEFLGEYAKQHKKETN